MQRPHGDLASGLAVSWIAVYVMAESLQMPFRRTVWDSPGLAPAAFAAVLLLLGLALAASSVRSLVRQDGQGRGAGRQEGQVILALRNVRAGSLPSILLVGAYVLIGVPYVGFYPASLLFLLVSLLGWSRGWSRWAAGAGVASAAGVVALLYGVFHLFFKLPIR